MSSSKQQLNDVENFDSKKNMTCILRPQQWTTTSVHGIVHVGRENFEKNINTVMQALLLYNDL